MTKTSGKPTNLFHKAYEAALAAAVPCSICGTPGAPKRQFSPDGAHYLCEARRDMGLPTPPLDGIRCECVPCNERKTK